MVVGVDGGGGGGGGGDGGCGGGGGGGMDVARRIIRQSHSHGCSATRRTPAPLPVQLRPLPLFDRFGQEWVIVSE